MHAPAGAAAVRQHSLLPTQCWPERALKRSSVACLPSGDQCAPSRSEPDLVENQRAILHRQLEFGEARADESCKLQNPVARDAQLARRKARQEHKLVDGENVERMSQCDEHSLPDFDRPPIDRTSREESVAGRTEREQILSIVGAIFRDLDDVMKVKRENATTCRNGTPIARFS